LTTDSWNFSTDSKVYTTTTNSNWYNDTIWYIAGASGVEKAPESEKPETNLAWLDRRVEEMRVSL